MDNIKVGQLIYRLRKEKNLTQQQLAERMSISDKAVSKWERGLGCPDVSLLPELTGILGVELEQLLRGELDTNEVSGGNMRKMNFYICPTCGNVITSMTEAGISCCGKRLSAERIRKAAECEQLTVEIVENDFFITGEHTMTKEHYIAFAALLTGDGIMLRRLYPEWGLQMRIPVFAHGRLLWYCTKHGLFYRDV